MFRSGSRRHLTAAGRRWRRCAVALSILLAGLATVAETAPAQFTPPASPRLVSVNPKRMVDTRAVVPGGPSASITPSSPLTFSPLSQFVLGPNGAAAVIMNITATNVRSDPGGCFLRAYPTGAAVPASSNLNVLPGQTLPNLAVIQPGVGGQVTIAASCVTDVIVDVTGWIEQGAGYSPVQPTRLTDTRSATRVGPIAGPLSDQVPVTINPLEGTGYTANDVSGLLANITVVAPTGGGYLSTWPTGSARPNASSLNFGAGETFANATLVALGPDGTFELMVAGGSAHVIVDVFGWIPMINPPIASTTPVRMLDTRIGQGDCTPACTTLGPGGTIAVLLTGTPGLTPGTKTAVLKVTATNITAPSYLTVWPTGSSMPLASNLNLTPADTVPNLVIVPVGPDGRVNVLNAAGSTDVLIDLVGHA